MMRQRFVKRSPAPDQYDGRRCKFARGAAKSGGFPGRHFSYVCSKRRFAGQLKSSPPFPRRKPSQILAMQLIRIFTLSQKIAMFFKCYSHLDHNPLKTPDGLPDALELKTRC